MDVFKKAVIEGLYFETGRGVLSVCEVAQLPTSELRNLYRELKEVVAVEDDPLLKDEESEQETSLSKNRLRFEVVRELLVYRKEEAKRTKLLQQKKELEQVRSDLAKKHRRVLQALAKRVKVNGKPELVGWGISFAKPRELLVRIDGRPFVVYVDPKEAYGITKEQVEAVKAA